MGSGLIEGVFATIREAGDIHIEPELRAAEGLAACLHHLRSQKDVPSFVISGGDSVFDMLKASKERVELQCWRMIWPPRRASGRW